jgi:cytochrome bd-type quinol oxidase subunit 1
VKEFTVYTLARIGLFVASYAVVVGVYLLIAGTHTVPLIWPFVVAIVISAVASYYLLKGPRARFAMKVEQRAAAASRRFEAARAKEDAD